MPNSLELNVSPALLHTFANHPFHVRKDNYALVEKEGLHPFDYERRAENNFAAFMKNVQEINNIELDDDESDT